MAKLNSVTSSVSEAVNETGCGTRFLVNNTLSDIGNKIQKQMYIELLSDDISPFFTVQNYTEVKKKRYSCPDGSGVNTGLSPGSIPDVDT